MKNKEKKWSAGSVGVKVISQNNEDVGWSSILYADRASGGVWGLIVYPELPYYYTF